MKERLLLLLGVSAFATLLTTTAIVGCSGGSSTPTTATTSGTVSVHLIDPPTCATPNGNFSHVWITVTRVQANISTSAGPNDSGWVDLVDLRSAPKQLDLFNLASTSCVLNQLGSTTGLPPGKYQQIRFYLLDNSPSGNTAVPSSNQCSTAGAYNCVVLADNSVKPLALSSEAKTGIKIPPGSLAGGGITIAAGQAADITIDFSACESIILEGNGTYRLKPTLRAGEVALQQNSIGGRVVDSVTKKPVANALVALEQPDPVTGVDRIVRSALSASDGTFFFCPLPAGPYDIVVNGSTTNAAYITTLTTNVSLGTAVGDIPITPQPGSSTASLPGTINGLVTTAGGNGSDIVLSALQAGSSTLQFTVPLLPGSSSIITTGASSTCPTGTNCANYSLVVPASNPVVGTYSSTGTAYAAPATGTVNYSVDALAFLADGSDTPNCSPSEIVTKQDIANVTLAVLPGAPIVAKTTSFTGCQ
ncbi:MAG TPA: DUF4382 domain-containing protein [Acidisarcina sp.]|nr:DUF4382 domain-containing protein [Acidisarcina sp.]